MTIARWVALAVLAAGLALAPRAWAQPKKGRELHESAQKAYDVGKFAEAAELWTQAYEADPQPLFLFNIGRAYMNEGDCRSVRLFDRFVKVAGKSSQLSTARELAEQERTRCGKKIDKAKGFGELGEKAMREGQCVEAAGFFRDQLEARKHDDFNEASATELAAITERIADADACVKSTEKERRSLDAAEEHRLAGRCREAIGAYEAYLEAREANAALPLADEERARIDGLIADLRADPCSTPKPPNILRAARFAVRLQVGAAMVSTAKDGMTPPQILGRLSGGYLGRIGHWGEWELGMLAADNVINIADSGNTQVLMLAAHARLGYVGAAQMTFGLEADGGVAAVTGLGETNALVDYGCTPAEDADCDLVSSVVAPYVSGGLFVEFAITRKLALGATGSIGVVKASSPTVDLTPMLGLTGGLTMRF